MSRSDSPKTLGLALDVRLIEVGPGSTMWKMAVEPLPSMREGGEIWASIGHPVNPDKLALAVGTQGSTFNDHSMRWDNSGKNGHYAPIHWSN